ncbi:DUF1254 domain-containing protein [Paracoccus litorisediminis]|uniref:DUF1254 domain-containing protein n=1 Tax=Paracoccus litorisediminis TaxID=2006130 RepID=A0A844HNV3_9RHOB|nr:DUF1254 domain-containing protein [Paracoccus litorisediminis]MTH60789.1 DUF1254 domain-containing protein [Paracoccus litorisediminis]
MNRRELLQSAALIAVLPMLGHAQTAPAGDVATTAHDAYIHLFPMVENYLSIYQWMLDPSGSQYKGPPNAVHNEARVYTPADTGVVTPNSDTPYSYLMMDLRAEPLVLTLPQIEPGRYYSAQLIDLYTDNVDYLGTRVDGNDGGDFLIAGPDWKGDPPKGVKRVIRMPTHLALAFFRTQLMGSDDMPRVQEIQKGYLAEPLSSFTGAAAPPAAPAIDWPRISRETAQPDFWKYANFLLQFAPPLPWEGDLRARFATIGIAPGAPWPPEGMTPETLAAITTAADAAKAELEDRAHKLTSSAGMFGTPEEMRGKDVERAVAALAGLYGNSTAEALYPNFPLDAQGNPLDGSKSNYRLTFTKDAMPPVDAFWSVTMYDGKTRFLVDNPLNRYLINSPMLPGLKTAKDGSLTLYLQHESPGPDLETNWLPAPDGPMNVVMRLYLPKPAAIDGSWKQPPLEPVPK